MLGQTGKVENLKAGHLIRISQAELDLLPHHYSLRQDIFIHSSSIMDSDENSKIERAKALLAAKSLTSPDGYATIESILAPNDAENVTRTIEGLSQEDEFALMCRLMGTATHIVPLEQRPIIKGEFIVPDFMVSFQPGCTPMKKPRQEHGGFRCFIEVKSTKDMKFKISGSALRKRRAFADEFGLPLLFAVRFLKFNDHALWVMVEDRDRSKSSLKINVNNLTQGVRHVLWDDYFLIVLPSVHFRAVYEKVSPSKSNGVRHVDYGALREFHLVAPPGRVISGPHVVNNAAIYTGAQAGVLSAFFEGFQPELIAIETENNTTTLQLQPTAPCSITDLVYSYNRLPRDDDGRVLLNPSRILAGTDPGSSLATREFIEKVASDLWGSILGNLTFGHDDDHLISWEKLQN